jgi:hypothetical protein
MTGGPEQGEGLVLGVKCVLGRQCQDQLGAIAVCAGDRRVVGRQVVETVTSVVRVGRDRQRPLRCSVHRLAAYLGRA